MRENLIVTSDNSDQAALRGIAWLVQTAATTSEDGLIAVNGFAVLDRVAGRLLGTAGAKHLRAGTGTINGVRVKTMSDARPLFDFAGPVLALFPSAKLLDRLDNMYSITHLLVIPWMEKDAKDWVRAWNPRELGEEPQEEAIAEIASPVVQTAMNDLLLMINTSTGIVHPSDKQTAIEIFRCLKLNGVTYDPDEIRAWLVGARDLDPADANDIRDLANKILEGRTVQGAGPARKDTRRFKMWTEKVGKPSQP